MERIRDFVKFMKDTFDGEEYLRDGEDVVRNHIINFCEENIEKENCSAIGSRLMESLHPPQLFFEVRDNGQLALVITMLVQHAQCLPRYTRGNKLHV